MPHDKGLKEKGFKKFATILKTVKKTFVYCYKISSFHTFGLIAFTIIFALFPILEIWVSSRILDELIKQVTVASELNLNLVKLISFLVGIYFLDSMVRSTKRYFDINLRERVGIQVETDVSAKLAYLDAEYYDNPEINDLVNRVKSKFANAPYRFTYDMIQILEDLIKTASGVAVLFVLTPWTVVITFVAALPELLFNAKVNKESWAHFNDKTAQRRDYHHIQDYLNSESSIGGLKSFRIREYLFNRFTNSFKDYTYTHLKIDTKRTVHIGFVSLFGTLGKGINIIIIIQKAFLKTISIGDFYFYSGNLSRLENGLYNFFARLVGLHERSFYMNDIYELFELKPMLKDGEKNLVSLTQAPTIEFRNVSFKYPGTDKLVIENFNLLINPEENLAIVGENGAGKTTLIKLLMRFYDVTSGEILIDGINVKELKLDELYKLLGTLFQDYEVFHFDALTNIALGNPETIENIDQDLVESAAKASGAHEFISKYENGYAQILSKAFTGGINPSIGQKQKIALARVFYKNPPVLILDEPTSSIDPKAEFEIFEKLFEFALRKTVIIISHRFSTVRNAKRIIVLDDGKIIEEGTHEKLIQIDGGKYQTAFNLQKKGYE